VTAVVWVDRGGDDALLAAADAAMASYLMATAPALRSFAAPVLTERS
jgi:hypothetical protein